MEFIDSHCHFPKSLIKSKEWLVNANAAGVAKMVNIGTTVKGSRRAVKIAREFDGVYASVSVYPTHDLNLSFAEIEQSLRELLQEKLTNKIVGIGECGFNLPSDERKVKQQQELFELHLKLAQEFSMPIILHNRNGDEHVLESLSKYPITGVAHCFTQDIDFAHKLIEFGWYISFSGMVTFSENHKLRDVVTNLPIENIVIETDAPFLVPEHLRGQGSNEPKNVVEVAKVIAELKGLSLEEVASITTKNTQTLFSI